MKDIKNEALAGARGESDTEPVDTGRRQALARLGLTAAIAYAAPTLLPLTPASADSDSSGGSDGSNGHDTGSHGSGSSGHGSDSHDYGSDSHDYGSDSHDYGSDSHDYGSDSHGSDDYGTEPTEATEPSDSHY